MGGIFRSSKRVDGVVKSAVCWLGAGLVLRLMFGTVAGWFSPGSFYSGSGRSAYSGLDSIAAPIALAFVVAAVVLTWRGARWILADFIAQGAWGEDYSRALKGINRLGLVWCGLQVVWAFGPG